MIASSRARNSSFDSAVQRRHGAAVRLWLMVALCVLSTGCAVLEVAYLNSVEVTEFAVVGSKLYIGKEINSKTLEQFNALVAQHPELDTLVFTVVPGSVDDEINLALGRRVRELSLDTHLVGGGMIASGGVDLFVAGERRTMERGAFVGVHSWAEGMSKTGDEVARNSPEHAMYLDYYRALEIPEEFYWFTLEAAPASGMHWMSEEEMSQFHMLTEALLPAASHSSPSPFSELLTETRDSLASDEESATTVDGVLATEP